MHHPNSIPTRAHYVGAIIPLILQVSKPRHTKLSNMAKVSALVSEGIWAQTQQADAGAPASVLSPLDQPEEPRRVGGVAFSPPSHFQKLHDLPVRRSYEGISFLQSLQILGRHTKVSCKARISDRVLDGHSSTHSPGAWTQRHMFQIN